MGHPTSERTQGVSPWKSKAGGIAATVVQLAAVCSLLMLVAGGAFGYFRKPIVSMFSVLSIAVTPSLVVALVLGVAALPHVLMRFYTVPNSKEARRSVVWATCCMFVFYLCTLVIGFGAAALVGPDEIKSAPGGENSAAPLLALHIGGTLLLGIVSAVAFATILAVVAGLTITASASFAHDVYANIFKRGKAEAADEVRVARLTAVWAVQSVEPMLSGPCEPQVPLASCRVSKSSISPSATQ